MCVFVLGNDGKPLMPCSEKRARLLLERNRAFVKRIKPFVIQLKDRNQFNSNFQDMEIKIDPGSRFTGICLSRTVNKTVNVLTLMELEHRGREIKRKMDYRRLMRRSRRNRKTRYREPRFLNRRKPEGWLPPSLMHRVETTISWVKRLMRWVPIIGLVFERVKFDTQKLQNIEISKTEYQQGTLFQYDIKEYLLEKFNRTCMYCNTKHAMFEIEHIIAKSSGGSNRISNLGLSCGPCNQKKGSVPIEIFLKYKPELLKKIKNQLKISLKDSAVMNATRNRLFSELLKTGLPVETGTGSQTKFNRSQFNIPKTHALDAACCGEIYGVNYWNIPHMGIRCTGRGRYSRTTLNKYGFPKSYFPKEKKIFEFQTGDLVKALIKNKESIKSLIGRIMVRSSGYFSLIVDKNIFNVKCINCKTLQKADGYTYFKKEYSFLNVNNFNITLGNL